ncbi:hypothetical protein KQ945_14525 [Bacillus subtilis subsp. subtilis]|nr:hypothetical protein [Bacillus subtilis subsp. subtilis]
MSKEFKSANTSAKMKVLALQELEGVSGGLAAWSTTSEGCNGVTKDEWSTFSKDCLKDANVIS